MKKNKKNNLFWKIYAVSLATLTVIMAVALIIGYNVMIDYEEAQGVLSAESAKIAEEIAAGNFDVLFSDENEQTAPMIFEKEAYIEKLSTLIKKGVTSRKGFSSDRYTRPVYDIIAGDEKIASVHFVKAESESSFGFDTFKIEKIIPKTDGKYSVSVYVPEGADLYLNDTVFVGSKWIEQTIEENGNAENSLFSEQQSKRIVKYTVSGLFENYEPKVVYAENNTEADIFFDEETKAWRCEPVGIEILAPSNCEVYVNGVVVSGVDRFISEYDIKIEDAAVALKYIEENITMVRYKVSGLEMLTSVEVTAKSFNGGALDVVVNPDSGVYEVSFSSDESLLASFGVDKNWLIKRAEGYAKAICADASKYDELLAYVLKDTEAYAELEDFWVVFSRHNTFWIENSVCEELNFYGSEMFSATVSLDYWIKGFDGNANATKVYPTTVTFFYVQRDGGLKIVDYALG